ncbi:MAG TPA: hypothetical protein VHT96_15040 [Clostridia bacterium]|nr:hypothetical protein [Clostridia bacterium]
MAKAKNSSAGRFFYSFGTVILFAVLTICIINFTRDGRIFQKATPTVSTKTASNSVSATEGTIKIDTSGQKTPTKRPVKKQTQPAKTKPATDAGITSGSAVQPSNPGEEP